MSHSANTYAEAGTLLLSRLQMFNEAAVLFETEIDPTFWRDFDRCLAQFCSENDWLNHLSSNLEEYCWLAHPDWVISGEDCRAWFETYLRADNNNDYRLAMLTGNGSSAGEYGFLLVPKYKDLGGVDGYQRGLKECPTEILHQLAQLGFRTITGRQFFLPLRLDAQLMAQCWQQHCGFPPDSPLFEPLRAALKTLQDAVPVISQLLDHIQAAD